MPQRHDTVQVNGKGGAAARQGKTIVETAARSRGAQKAQPEPRALREPAVHDGWLDFDLSDDADEKDQAVYASIRNRPRASPGAASTT